MLVKISNYEFQTRLGYLQKLVITKILQRQILMKGFYFTLQFCYNEALLNIYSPYF